MSALVSLLSANITADGLEKRLLLNLVTTTLANTLNCSEIEKYTAQLHRWDGAENIYGHH